MTAGEFLELYHYDGQWGQWDCVATCFFLDCAHNVVEYLECIGRLLRPGGLWIHFGPLMYHYTSDAADELSIELDWESIKAIAPAFQLILQEEETQIRCNYIPDHGGMHTTQYKCVFAVFEKSEEV